MEIPKRALFKASEVCEIASVQPYVLRSWELEFPGMGVAKAAGGPRIYRRSDVEQVLRIRQLVFAEGLTLAGVRRRMEDEAPVALEEPVEAPVEAPTGRSARARLADVKKGLTSILAMLNARPGQARQQAQVSAAPVAAPAGRRRESRIAKPAGKPKARTIARATARAKRKTTRAVRKKPRNR